ncbi:MAG: MarR family transcriptional regulator [Bacilli bacterium]|nr:MarR family transcriptional regulator [Bacilli bacterium]MBN2876167.1 MarR family transcriptional regulator [Bacilli bacterium]
MDREEVRKAFNRFLKMYFNSSREVYEEINFKEITGKQFKYLKLIREQEKATFSELAKLFHISKPTLTETINKFLDAGLVKKTRCEEDQRVYYISLTERGEILAMTNELESKKAVSKIYERLSNEEIELAVRLFNKMGDDIE